MKTHRITDVLHHVDQYNPTISKMRQKILEAEEGYHQARSGWLPKLNAEASIYTSNIENSNFNNGDGATTKDASINLDQPIWYGGRTFANVNKSKADIESAKHFFEKARQDIFLQTVTIYTDVIRNVEILNLRKKNENLLSTELASTVEQNEMGAITKTDVEQAKTRLLKAQSETIKAQSNLHITYAEFEEVTGMRPPQSLYPIQMTFIFPNNLEDMFHIAETYDPNLKAVAFEEKAAQYQEKSLERDLYPKLSAFASASYQQDPQPGIVPRSETQTIGLKAAIPLYQGGAARSRIRQAKHAAMVKNFETRSVQKNVHQTIARYWHNYQAAMAEKQYRMSEIAAAKETLVGVKEEAKIGQRRILDILNADQEVIEAKINFAQAKRNEIVAQFSLAQKLGLFTIPDETH